MSYILDALKKSQAAEQGDQVAFNLGSTRRHIPPWVYVAITILLVANAALLVWIFYPTSMETAQIASPGVAAEQPAVVAREGDPAPKPRTEPAPAATSPAAAERQPTTATTAEPAASAPPAEAPAPVFLQTFELDSLPAGERDVFLSLNYTSHIYSDDPSACAVVIDGQRYANGDTVGALQISEITPDGVIFRQTASAGDRLVAVSIIEIWNSR